MLNRFLRRWRGCFAWMVRAGLSGWVRRRSHDHTTDNNAWHCHMPGTALRACLLSAHLFSWQRPAWPGSIRVSLPVKPKNHISQAFLQIGAATSLRFDQSHVASPGKLPRQHPVCLGGAKRQEPGSLDHCVEGGQPASVRARKIFFYVSH